MDGQCLGHKFRIELHQEVGAIGDFPEVKFGALNDGLEMLFEQGEVFGHAIIFN